MLQYRLPQGPSDIVIPTGLPFALTDIPEDFLTALPTDPAGLASFISSVESEFGISGLPTALPTAFPTADDGPHVSDIVSSFSQYTATRNGTTKGFTFQTSEFVSTARNGTSISTKTASAAQTTETNTVEVTPTRASGASASRSSAAATSSSAAGTERRNAANMALFVPAILVGWLL